MKAQDIELIAAALRVARSYINEKEPKTQRPTLLNGVDCAASYIAVMLSDCDKRFDPEDFLLACGNTPDSDGRPAIPGYAPN